MGKVKEQLLFEDVMPNMNDRKLINSQLNDNLELTIDTNVSGTSVIISMFDNKLKEGQTMFISKEDALDLADKLKEFANG